MSLNTPSSSSLRLATALASVIGLGACQEPSLLSKGVEGHLSNPKDADGCKVNVRSSQDPKALQTMVQQEECFTDEQRTIYNDTWQHPTWPHYDLEGGNGIDFEASLAALRLKVLGLTQKTECPAPNEDGLTTAACFIGFAARNQHGARLDYPTENQIWIGAGRPFNPENSSSPTVVDFRTTSEPYVPERFYTQPFQVTEGLNLDGHCIVLGRDTQDNPQAFFANDCYDL